MRKLVAVVAVVIGLAGCNRERVMPTAEYGSGVIVGRMVMADGGSPAGVEVSVGGTGMATVVGADGRFSFAGVPSSPVLQFRRAADGIDTRITTTQGSITVEVGRLGAKLQGRKSGRLHQTEGVVVSGGSEELVVRASAGDERTFRIVAATVIRHGNRMLVAADLTAGARVHVKSTLADGVHTAVEIKLQNPDGSGEGEGERGGLRQYEGRIRSVSADELVVLDSHGQEVTFTLEASTIIRKGGTAMTADELEAGWRVHVKAVVEGDSRTAAIVIVQNTNGGGGSNNGGGEEGEGGQTMTANGEVLAVGASQLTVRSQPHGEVTVLVDAGTIIKKQGQQIAVTDILPGDEVNCRGTRVDASTLRAVQIEVRGKGGRK